MAVMSTYLDKSVVDSAKLYHLLAKAWDQRKKDIAEAWVVLGESKARATKVKKVLGKIEAKGTKVDTRVASTKAKAIEAKARAWVAEEALCKAKDRACAM